MHAIMRRERSKGNMIRVGCTHRRGHPRRTVTGANTKQNHEERKLLLKRFMRYTSHRTL